MADTIWCFHWLQRQLKNKKSSAGYVNFLTLTNWFRHPTRFVFHFKEVACLNTLYIWSMLQDWERGTTTDTKKPRNFFVVDYTTIQEVLADSGKENIEHESFTAEMLFSLPLSNVEGEWYIHHQIQDIIAIPNNGDHPKFCITLTCGPAWLETSKELEENLKA